MSCQRCGKATCSLRYGCETSYDLGVRDGIEKGRTIQQDLEYMRGGADGEAITIAAILGVNATKSDAAELARILQAYHKGSERGELLALLVRLWGESPSIVTNGNAAWEALARMVASEANATRFPIGMGPRDFMEEYAADYVYQNKAGLYFLAKLGAFMAKSESLTIAKNGEFMDERAENIDRLDASRILADVETHVGTPSHDRILSEAERVATADMRGLAARESQLPCARVPVCPWAGMDSVVRNVYVNGFQFVDTSPICELLAMPSINPKSKREFAALYHLAKLLDFMVMGVTVHRGSRCICEDLDWPAFASCSCDCHPPMVARR